MIMAETSDVDPFSQFSYHQIHLYGKRYGCAIIYERQKTNGGILIKKNFQPPPV